MFRYVSSDQQVRQEGWQERRHLSQGAMTLVSQAQAPVGHEAPLRGTAWTSSGMADVSLGAQRGVAGV